MAQRLIANNSQLHYEMARRVVANNSQLHNNPAPPPYCLFIVQLPVNCAEDYSVTLLQHIPQKSAIAIFFT